jgi:hypothetical protein
MRLRIHSLRGSGMRETIDSGNRTPTVSVVSSLIGGRPMREDISSNAMPSRYPSPRCFLNSSSLVAAANHNLWSAPVPNFSPWYARRKQTFNSARLTCAKPHDQPFRNPLECKPRLAPRGEYIGQAERIL